jgi:predicted nucleic-acid-binding protein
VQTRPGPEEARRLPQLETVGVRAEQHRSSSGARICNLAAEPELFLADLIVAETLYVLESFYKTPRDQIATAMRSLVALRCVVTVDPALLLRALEVYEIDRIDFAEAYLVACAESSGVNRIASFDRSIDRAGTIERIELPET